MRQVNLISLCNICKNDKLKENYLQYCSIRIKDGEINDIEKLITALQNVKGNDYIFDDYFVGFSIPQIGKEFDLLRIGENSIVNIEVKRQATEETILEQLHKNQYYLSFLDKEIFKFTYISENNKLYKAKHNGLEVCEFDVLVETLVNQQTIKDCDIENLFNPSDYLVSPFNSTDKFIRDEYFLTQQQSQIKKDVLKIIENQTNHFIAIRGSAGTGKTLLTYDIAKHFVNNKKNVLIIHCGNLNDGHFILKQKYNWNIRPIKDTFKIDFSSVFLVILDECQRVNPNQLRHILEQNKIFLFSYDLKQFLKNDELNNNFERIIEEKKANLFHLKAKIRTNREIASFIKCLFDRQKQSEHPVYPNIYINYFDKVEEAKKYINHLHNDWKIINYTPDSRKFLSYEEYNIEGIFDNSHKVIGQEFDNVLVVIGQDFLYKDDKLYFEGVSYYNPVQMLYQNVTRVRKRLSIVVVNNVEIFARCVEILK